ncbi:hypothetical protein EV385_5929 [Krasilnikovia cinnamomea]|uniref:Uncharacterized protein n=1 Tax=Krasilnikovia cinnamomea TaxID=349313 RepID=A0A4Q7ZS48_9ACTN|nr:hypothetical protein [Krasilnikovia cinnamomea]RZU53992.1 hypothetical protein EV385_5929 [Krasilnikovia cinnamomea]
MAPARSLHEIIAGLTGTAGTPVDLAAVLRSGGHPDLPEELLAEAVVSFADTAPAEVAEHLAPFVMAHGPITEGDTVAGGIGDLPDLLAAAPAAAADDGPDLAAPEIDPLVDMGGGHEADDLQVHDAGQHEWAPLEMAFGHGHDHDHAAVVDDIDFETVAPQPQPGYGDHHDPHHLPGLPDVAPDAELWETPTLPDHAHDIGDLDDLDDN